MRFFLFLRDGTGRGGGIRRRPTLGFPYECIKNLLSLLTFFGNGFILTVLVQLVQYSRTHRVKKKEEAKMYAMPIISSVIWVISALSIAYLAYFALYLPGVLGKPAQYAKHAPSCRFAVLVAARNEEAVIGNLVESLMAQNYPRELFDVIAIPNNCTDDTAGAAARAGAQIMNCRFPVHAKGDALRQVIAELMRMDRYDAVCVFDADNLVDPGFLAAMNDAWCAGARAAQGYRDSKNPLDTTISSCYSIYYWMVNRMFSHTRARVGLSAIVNGSGFMVSMDWLRAHGGWNTVTLTEDIEFTTRCILGGERVAWVPEAKTYDEQPLTFLQSWHQRCRWSVGLYQCLRVYGGQLLAKRGNSRACIDQLLFLLAPLTQVLYVVSLILSGTLCVMQVHFMLAPYSEVLYQPLMSAALSFAGTVLLAILVIVLERKPLLPMAKGVLGYWLFVMSWIPINVYCLFKPDLEWKAIRHTRSVKMEQLK